MSRNKTKTKRALRAFLAASSALVLITAVAPLADAAGGKPDKQSNNGKGKSEVHGRGASHGKSASHGKTESPGEVSDTSTATANVILKTITTSPLLNGRGKKFENNGKAFQAQSNSLLKKLAKLGSTNPAVAVALTTYINTVDTATATMQIAVKSAKTTFHSAVTVATTDTAKQSAEAAYKAAVLLAEQNFNTALQAANLALKAALSTLLPPPNTPGSPAPVTTVSPSPSST